MGLKYFVSRHKLGIMDWGPACPGLPTPHCTHLSPPPRPADPLWFAVDRPVDDKEEAEHSTVGGDVGDVPAGISDVDTLGHAEDS